MSVHKLKNNASWEILFEKEKIIEYIERDGFFYISSSKINEQREARLMTKFDHGVQLPKKKYSTDIEGKLIIKWG